VADGPDMTSPFFGGKTGNDRHNFCGKTGMNVVRFTSGAGGPENDVVRFTSGGGRTGTGRDETSTTDF